MNQNLNLGILNLSILEKMRNHVHKMTLGVGLSNHVIRSVCEPGNKSVPQEANSQFKLDTKEIKRNKGRLSDYLEYTGRDHNAVWLYMYSILLDKERTTPSFPSPKQFRDFKDHQGYLLSFKRSHCLAFSRPLPKGEGDPTLSHRSKELSPSHITEANPQP